MKIIELNNLKKEYQRPVREEGFKGSLKGLLCKTTKRHIAVNDFEMVVEKGEFVGLIGPNGAGKTTLIKMLTGIIQPTSGTVKVMDFVPIEGKNTFKKKIAVVMGQKSQLWFDLPATDSFLLNKKLYGIDDITHKNRLSYLTKLLDVGELLQVPVRNLSLGERMKMEFLLAMIHNPVVIFLDEPTIGLDAISQRQMWDFLKTINQDLKKTILLTSHYMEDIRRLCNRTIVINGGKKIYDGDFKGLIEKYQKFKIISLTFDSETELLVDLPVKWIEKTPYKCILQVDKMRVSRVLQEIFQKYEPSDVMIREEDIDAIIQKIYNREEK